MKAIATHPAYYKGKRIRVGDEVNVPDGSDYKWCVPASEYKPETHEPEPTTLSEIARRPAGRPPKTSKGKASQEPQADDSVI